MHCIYAGIEPVKFLADKKQFDDNLKLKSSLYWLRKTPLMTRGVFPYMWTVESEFISSKKSQMKI